MHYQLTSLKLFQSFFFCKKIRKKEIEWRGSRIGFKTNPSPLVKLYTLISHLITWVALLVFLKKTPGNKIGTLSFLVFLRKSPHPVDPPSFSCYAVCIITPPPTFSRTITFISSSLCPFLLKWLAGLVLSPPLKSARCPLNLSITLFIVFPTYTTFPNLSHH